MKVCKIITVSLCRPNGESPWRGDNLSYSHPPGACACQQKIQILVIGRLTFLQSQVRMYVRGERCLPETLRNTACLVPRRLQQMHFNSSTLHVLVQKNKVCESKEWWIKLYLAEINNAHTHTESLQKCTMVTMYPSQGRCHVIKMNKDILIQRSVLIGV